MRKKVTYKGIMGFKPCYDPTDIGMPKTYSKPVKEFIDEYKDKVEDKEDILWLLCRKEYMTDRDCRLFAVWCAREALKLVKEPDQRSINACNVAEKFANGEATKKELDAARAASAAASAAAWAAAWAASAATRAARAAASDAASAAASAARDAAWAASAATWDAQIEKLKTYFI